MLKSLEVPTKAIAELTVEMNKPRIAASVALTGYKCSRCGCQFPESKPPKGRTAVESQRLAKAHTAREFALHVCAERGWPPDRIRRVEKQLH
jgi:DNA-directed RNA polymerase subunit RPC12/RpoP